ncbi:MAG: hypothetical protein ACR2GE_00500 [Pseudonocardia sp.]
MTPPGQEAEAPTPPTGLATDPAMSAQGWNQAPPLALADAVAQPQVGAPTVAPQPANAYPNSAPPGPNGSPPSEEYTIKGNEGSRRFHTPDSPFYIRTRADVWFRTTEDAERAGFTPWSQRRR